MKSMLFLSIALGAMLTLTGDVVARPANPPTPPDDVQVITVTAKKYEFNPSPIRVKQGTKVQLKITAMDHTHGFSVQEVADGDHTGKPGLVFSTRGCQKIEEGQTAMVEFVAQTPGTYPFRCCVHCGWGHRGMKGEIIVEP